MATPSRSAATTPAHLSTLAATASLSIGVDHLHIPDERATAHRRAFLAGPLTELIDGRGPEELLFTAPGGGVLRNTNFRSRVFERAKADLGLGALRIHDRRHTGSPLLSTGGLGCPCLGGLPGGPGRL